MDIFNKLIPKKKLVLVLYDIQSFQFNNTECEDIETPINNCQQVQWPDVIRQATLKSTHSRRSFWHTCIQSRYVIIFKMCIKLQHCHFLKCNFFLEINNNSVIMVVTCCGCIKLKVEFTFISTHIGGLWSLRWWRGSWVRLGRHKPHPLNVSMTLSQRSSAWRKGHNTVPQHQIQSTKVTASHMHKFTWRTNWIFWWVKLRKTYSSQNLH